jgi:hypothetical protein
VWTSNRPAKGGESGAMLATIIERAAKLKAGRSQKRRTTQGSPRPQSKKPRPQSKK